MSRINKYKADYPAYPESRRNPIPRHELEETKYRIDETVTEALRRKEDESSTN